MEAVFLSSSPTSDQSIFPSNKIRSDRNKTKIIHSSFNNLSRSSENFFPPHSNLFSNIHGSGAATARVGVGAGAGAGEGIFYGSPPNLSSSFPLLLNHHHLHQQQQQQQPPLLPLPVTKPYSSLPLLPVRNNNKVAAAAATRGSLPFSPTTNNKKNKINNNNRIRSDQQQDHHHHLKSKSSTINPKKRDSSTRSIITKRENTTFVVESNNRLGPEPGDLPKEVSRVFKPHLDSSNAAMEKGHVEVEFSAIFSLAPPPSSLPLPKFSLRPKLSCNVEAAGGIDDGATDNLRRLLRLR